MSLIAENAERVESVRYTSDQLSSKSKVLAILADAWDELHRGMGAYGSGRHFVEPVRRLRTSELIARFFSPIRRDDEDRWTYSVDPVELNRIG